MKRPLSQPICTGLFVALLAGCPTTTEPDTDGPESDTDTDADTDADADTDSDADTDTDTDADTDSDAPTVTGFIVYPSQPLVPVGSSIQLRGRSTYSDGTSVNVTPDTTWYSPTSAVGVLAPDGEFTAAAAGAVQIDATYDGETVNAWLQAHPADDLVALLDVLPGTAQVGVGRQMRLSAYATLASGIQGDLAARCSWASSDPTVAVVGASGAVETLGAGLATITATCPRGDGTDIEASAALDVGAPPLRADLVIADLEIVTLAPDRFRIVTTMTNTGGFSGPFVLDIYNDRLAEPTAPSTDTRLPIVGLGTDTSLTVQSEVLWTGPQPHDATTWVIADLDNDVNDLTPDDNVASIEHEIAPLDSSDVEVVFDSFTIFGPTDVGVIVTVTNNGPDTLNGTVYFERDAPGTTMLVELEPLDAERSQTITVLPNESYVWLFDYDQVPFGTPWYLCAFVPLDGFADDDVTNNLDCMESDVY